MTLVVNLVRIVSSAKFICCCWRNPWCDYHVTHTPKCNESVKIGQIINCGLTILIVSVFPVLLTNYDTAQIWRCWKMAGIFTERIWQPCICQPNELKREIKKKTGGPSKKLGGGHGPPRPPLRIATEYDTVTSPVSCCDCCLIDTWFAWSWRWLAIAALPLPPQRAKGVAYEASKTASQGSVLAVLATLLFNIYTSDLPITVCRKYVYADDL